MGKYEEVENEPNENNKDQDIANLDQKMNEELAHSIKYNQLTAIEVIENTGNGESDDDQVFIDEFQSESDSSENQEGKFLDWKKSVEEEGLQNAANKAIEKTDGLDAHVRENAMRVTTSKNIDEIDDSSDE